MTTEPEPIDWSTWGVKSPDQVRRANLKEANDVRMAQMKAPFEWHASPEGQAHLERQIKRESDHKARMAEIEARHEDAMKRHRAEMAELNKREMVFEIQNEIDTLKKTVAGLSEAVNDLAVAVYAPRIADQLSAITKNLKVFVNRMLKPRQQVVHYNKNGTIHSVDSFIADDDDEQAAK